MANFERRLSFLEKTLIKHLEESGMIRTDLKWLKHAFWALFAGAITFGSTFLIKK